MPIRDSLARMLGLKASVIGLAADELPDRALEKAHDDRSLLSTYADDAWPYIVGNKVGEQASQAPLQVGRIRRLADGAEEFVPAGADHPVQRLLDAPNPTMDGGEFIHTLMLYMGFAGHAPIEVVRPMSGARRVTRNRGGFELWLHEPSDWRVVANPDATVKGYLWVKASESDIKWTPEQMTYIRWPNPSDRWYGQGHIAAIRQQVMAEEYAAIRDKKLEKQLGVPPGILTSEMPLGDPQAAELQRRWEKAVGGYANAGRVAVLGSKTTYQPVTMSARDSEWLAHRRDRVEIICAAWGVPLPLVRMQDATFSNVEQARAEFWEGTLQPRLNRIARMLTARLVPLLTTEPIVLRFDYSDIEALGENDLQAAQTAAQWAGTGSVTVNEVRARLGLNPHPDKAVGERLMVPSTMTLTDTATMAEREALGIEGQRAAAMPREMPDDEPPAPRRSRKAEALNPDRETVLAPVREAFARDLGSFFAAQHAALTPALGKALPSDEADAIIERAIAILNGKRWRDRLARFAEPAIRSSITLGAAGAAETLSVATSFAIPASEAAVRLLTTHLEALGVGIQNTTVAEVRAILERTLRAGATNAETRAALRELFDGYADWRLDRISRTETAAAYNLGAIGQYRDAGITMVTVVDGDLDEACAVWNGRYTTLADAEGSPLGHPNCRRTWIPDTSGLGRGRNDVAARAEREERDRVTKERHEELLVALATRPEPPSVNVTIAEGAVSAPIINVAPPAVNVAAAEVNVPKAAAPQVNVTMPSDIAVRVVAMPEVVRTVERDAAGNIVRVIES